jgi:O-antigen ligase
MRLDFLKRLSRADFVTFSACVLVAALAGAKFLMSVGIWALAAAAVFELCWDNNRWRLRFQKPFRLLAAPYFWIAVPFFLVVISGFWSENVGYWLGRTRIKLPLLIFPLIFPNLPLLSKKQVQTIFYVLLVAFFVATLRHTLFYFTHFAESNIGLGQGKPIGSLRQHIPFGLTTVFAFFVGWDLWRSGFYLRYTWERRLIIGMTVFLFIALHILSIRTAILTLYVCLFLKILVEIAKSGKILRGGIALVFLALMPVVAYQVMPSFKQRINYAIWDLQHYQQGDLTKKSDSERITTLKMGVDVLQKHPIFGVGYGDIMDEVGKSYATFYPNLDVREPHSFWLFNAVGTGFVGMLLVTFAFFFLWLKHLFQQDILFSIAYMITLIGNVVDFTFEGTYGIIFYGFFISLMMRYCGKAVENPDYINNLTKMA